MHKFKLLIIGDGRHGKDTVSEILTLDYGYNFISSSQFCADRFIFDKLKDKYGYKTSEECFNDRHNHRSEWYDLICAYNEPDAGKLGAEIFDQYDIYCGLRNIREWSKMKTDDTYDYCIWVDRSKHLPPESKDSMSLVPECADYILNNNGAFDDLKNSIKAMLIILEQWRDDPTIQRRDDEIFLQKSIAGVNQRRGAWNQEN